MAPHHNEMLLILSSREIVGSLNDIDNCVGIDRLDMPKTPIEDPEEHLSIEEHQFYEVDLQPIKTPSKKKKNGCVCKKTNCLKLYCECFASGKLCTEDCACFKCYNIEAKQEAIENARFLRKSKNHIAGERKCNCRKSNCQKKYCECYNAGLECTSQCNCSDCHNMEGTK